MSGFQPDQPISIQLQAQAWNAVMHWLGKQPYEVVAALIGEIQRQCQMHEMRRTAHFPRVVPEDYGPTADSKE